MQRRFLLGTLALVAGLLAVAAVASAISAQEGVIART